MMTDKQLFKPVCFPKLALKNRFVRSAVWMQMADEEGHLTPALAEVYKRLADGGVGLIITGYACIDREDRPNTKMIGMYADEFVTEWAEVIAYVHQQGAKIALQIASGGSQTFDPEASQRHVMGPSPVRNRVTGILPEAMTEADIQHLLKNYRLAARRAKTAGFDAIQIHAAHGYLLSQFLTPYYNRRTDNYGGSLRNRGRLIEEVVMAVRAEVGETFPILIKLNFDDFMDPNEGLTFPESLELFRRMEAVGVDFIEPSATNESAGNGLKPAFPHIAKNTDRQSYFSRQVAQIAEAVSIPVILVGGNRQVERMQHLLTETQIQLFSLARTLFAEPDLINKWEEYPEYTPRCLSCNRCWEHTPNHCILP